MPTLIPSMKVLMPSAVVTSLPARLDRFTPAVTAKSCVTCARTAGARRQSETPPAITLRQQLRIRAPGQVGSDDASSAITWRCQAYLAASGFRRRRETLPIDPTYL